MPKKKDIYYARTYRRLKLNIRENTIFTLLLIVPTLILLILSIDDITGALAQITSGILSNVIPEEHITISGTNYSLLNTIYYVELPTTLPATHVIWINLAICLVMFITFKLMKVTGRPMAIYFLFSIFTHTVNCIYFLFAAKYFPYTLGEYSSLYLMQQVGVWITFCILGGLVVGYLGDKGYGYKLWTFICIMLYSLVFGAIRYIVYLFVLYKFSVLYMAMMFFVVGPMFDFSYFVAIYAAFVNKSIKEYESGDMKGEWEWS